MTAHQTEALALLAQASQALAAARRLLLIDPQPVASEVSDLAAAISAATFPQAGGPPISVALAISDPEVYLTHAGTLESQGITLTHGRRGQRGRSLGSKKFIFFEARKVVRYLLRPSLWTAAGVASVLRRAPGASPAQRVVGTRRPWGIEVPLVEWQALGGAGGALVADEPARCHEASRIVAPAA